MRISIPRAMALLLCLAAPLAGQDEKTVRTVYKEDVTVERTTTMHEVVTVQRKVKDRYKCAVFVKNTAERVPDKKVSAMQDLFTGYLTDKGFTVILREDVINAVANYAKAGANKGDRDLPGGDLDKILSNNTSALRLAENLGADYVLVVGITTYGTDTQTYKGNGMNVINKTHKMRATYRLLDGTTGGSATAGVATSMVVDRIDPRNGSIERENLVDDLIDATALDMSDMLHRASRAGNIDANTEIAAKEAEFNINVGVANLVFPEVIKTPEGKYEVLAGRYKLEAMAVAVELDGVVIGTTGTSALKARPGLHKLRLRREMFRDWEGTVKISQGQTLDIAMQMTNDGFKKFKEMSDFVQTLKERQALNEADVKVLEGWAQRLRQSGFKVDIQSTERQRLATDIFDPIMGAEAVTVSPPTTQP